MLLVLGAGLGCAKPEDTADSVAAYRGGEVTLSQVELALGRSSEMLGQEASREDLVDAYRRSARAVAFRDLLLNEVGGEEAALGALGEEREDLLRRSIIELYRQEKMGGRTLQVTNEEVASYYAENEDRFRRPARRNTWHLFRRDQDPAEPEATLSFLEELRQRVLAGEAFSELAKEYSDSETRAIGGHLGWMERGRMPPALDDVLFSLDEGEVSMPVSVPGGAVLFHVTEAHQELSFDEDEVHGEIVRLLAERKTVEALEEAIERQEVPEGSLVLEPDAVRVLVDGGEAEETVLEIAGFELTVAEFRDLLQRDLRALEQAWSTRREERIQTLYTRQVQDQLFYLEAVRSGFPDLPENARRIENRLTSLGQARLVEREVEQRLRQRAEADSAGLQRFYAENRFLYQSPLRLRLDTLVLSPRGNGSRAMARMVAAREQLQNGEGSLEELAQRIGGRVLRGELIDFETLTTFEPKVRYYVLDLNGTGYTVPFQLNGRLHMVWVRERLEPQELPFEEVRDRVLTDYQARLQQSHYRELQDQVLASNDFRFNAEVVEQALAVSPAASGADGEQSAPLG